MFAWDVGIESIQLSRDRDRGQALGEGPEKHTRVHEISLPSDDYKRRNIDRAYWTFQLFALIYNLEHGIIPAALPQIRHYYHTTALLEASTQCASVFGTQLGVCLSRIHRPRIITRCSYNLQSAAE